MIRSAERSQFLSEIKSVTHERLIIHPNTSETAELTELDQLEALFPKLQVHLGGVTFPKLAREDYVLARGKDYIEGYYDARDRSIFRLYTSGQFVYFSSLLEDLPDIQPELRKKLGVSEKDRERVDGFLEYGWRCSMFVEYYAFARRLALHFDEINSWSIESSLLKPGLRALSTLDTIRRAGFWNLYFSETDFTFHQILDRSNISVEPGLQCMNAMSAFSAHYGFDARPEILEYHLTK